MMSNLLKIVEGNNEAEGFPNISIVVISNITLEHYFTPFIKNKFKKIDINPIVSYLDVNELYLQDKRKILEVADVIMIWIDIEVLFPDYLNDNHFGKNENWERTGFVKSFTEYIHGLSKGAIIWLSFQKYSEKSQLYLGSIFSSCNLTNLLNYELRKVMDSNTKILDLERMIATIGIAKAFNSKDKYRWASPYSDLLIDLVCKELYKQYLVIHGITKKCIVIDCDNVLWGGVLSEDGIENLILGNTGRALFYQEFQKYLVELYYCGVILAICSKNDLKDVLEVFNEHSAMKLKIDHIALFQVNWNSKADNIKLISEQLNISLDSIVFVDDSSFEIGLVNYELPDVTTILFDKNIFSMLNDFNLSEYVNYDSILKRNLTYKTMEKRLKLKNISKTYEDYLNSLNTKINIIESRDTDINRISELSQRTNKRTNGNRFTVNDLEYKLNSHKSNIYSVYVSDKFGDLGLVGGMIVTDKILELFCLSCRALGRNIENKMLDYVFKNNEVVNFIFKDTSKNNKLKKFLKESFERFVAQNKNKKETK